MPPRPPPYHHQPPRPDEPLRVLMLASMFPKPGREQMGVWALSQAQALHRQNIELTVVSFMSWLPRVIGRLKKSGSLHVWATCPPEHSWDGLRVLYPRWSIYQKGVLRRYEVSHPALPLALAWSTGRRALLRAVDELRPHVVYAHYTLPNGEIARRLRALRGIPYVLTDHARCEVTDCASMPARCAAFGAVLRDAAMWTGVSSIMRRDLGRLFPDARATVVPNGADPIAPDILSAPRPPELRGKTIVSSAGSFYPIKGFPDLVRAFARAAPRHPDAILRIVGDGQYRPQVEEAIRETGMAGRITVLGARPHREVLQEMAWSDVFALLSWDESFGVVFMEAAAAGKPIIWTDDVGAADVLRDGEHGRIVRPRDIDGAAAALDELLGDPDKRQRMGAAARENCLSNVTWDRAAERTVAILRDAAASPR